MNHTVTNTDTILSGVYFDPLFLEKREQWIKQRNLGFRCKDSVWEIFGSINVKKGFDCVNTEDKK